MVYTNRSVAIFVATAVMGVSISMAATQPQTGLIQGTIEGADGTTMELHRAYSFRERYDYNRALQLYLLYLQKGFTDIVKPDINDRSTIDVYLKNPTEDRIVPPEQKDPVSTKDYVKPPEEVIGQKELSQAERAALRRAEKIGVCPAYKGFSMSYYTYCAKMIEGKKQLRTTGFGNDIMTTRQNALSSIRSVIVPKSRYELLKDNRSTPRVSGRAASAASSSASSK